ncbi:transcriptional regulator with XRE-family HTH domain [Saccharothrix tamanrassetensis]|uniref:Transcriptional regulator with XRE-family HTH domain n=1 Tax=Saccharothrix tamanrassetensis TaxID=1051531 RepID=A0A841CCA0_9PSEU|nr:hypothetical protein [Saccharothrix tamanrassetensis]MBB5953798.1 transcriptional regulator with XRE-family HTH domain [Saccharothrix tamanrassetensis]
MRDALARREIGPVYRLLRRQGVSVERIVALTGQSPQDVSAAIDGRPVRDYDTLCRIAEGLGVPKGYMGLAHDERPTGSGRHCDCDEAVKRRRFLEHAARVTVCSAVLDSELPLWDGGHGASCRSGLPA